MKFKISTLLVISAAILAAQTVFAADQQQNNCLKVEVMRSVGVDTVEQQQDGTWGATKEDHYGTNATWIVVTGPIYAQSTEEALRKGNEALYALAFSSVSTSPPWPVCEYTGMYEGREIVGLAIPGNEGSRFARSLTGMLHQKRGARV